MGNLRLIGDDNSIALIVTNNHDLFLPLFFLTNADILKSPSVDISLLHVQVNQNFRE